MGILAYIPTMDTLSAKVSRHRPSAGTAAALSSNDNDKPGHSSPVSQPMKEAAR
jgi:hypothetical protein